MIVVGEIPKIEMDLRRPGVFFFLEGATGKTYLAESLIAYKDEGFCVITVIGNDILTFGDIESSKVIFMDRADLYKDDNIIKATVDKYADSKVILVDLKDLGDADGIVYGKSWGFANITLPEAYKIFVRAV